MITRRLLALLVVLVLSIAFLPTPAISAVPAQWRDASSTTGEVHTLTWKGENDSSGDDDRWGVPSDVVVVNGVETDDEADDSGGDPPYEPPPKSVGFGRIQLRFLFGNWFVL